MKNYTFIILLNCYFHIACQSTCTKSIEKSIVGKYRLNYYGKPGSLSGWSTEHREELLTLWKDSTFVLERISQGGFEVYPDSGVWSSSHSTIVLKIKITALMIEADYVPKNRIFKIVSEGLIEPTCREKTFTKTLWRKE